MSSLCVYNLAAILHTKNWKSKKPFTSNKEFYNIDTCIDEGETSLSAKDLAQYPVSSCDYWPLNNTNDTVLNEINIKEG